MANTKGTSVISNPQGGGAQQGLGEKFSPDLFTGTGNFSVPIAVPTGRNGFQPELTLGYSSGNGNGVFGMGWALGIPGVMRKTSKGIPVYDDHKDVFVLSGAEDLVPVDFEKGVSSGIGWEKTYYRPRTEGLFARIIRHKKTTGEHYWEVCSKDGLISWYGTPEAVSSDPAVIADPENRKSVFAWHLTKTQDRFGNVIIYNYSRDLVIQKDGRSYDQVYLTQIQYCQYPSIAGLKYLCELRFNYQERPDPFSNYRQGFEIRTNQRCISIESFTDAVSQIKTKTYHFNYLTDLPLNGTSLLESISVEGHDGNESEFMPPLVFEYSVFDPAAKNLKEIKGPFPAISVGEPGYEFVDLTGNGLPDLLQLNGVARYWTNKGNGEFSQPKNLDISPSVHLDTPGVRFFDANGDGRTDLLVNNGIVAGYFPGAFHQLWDSKGFVPYKQIPSFSFSDPEVQLIDLDGDGVTDVLRNGSRFECFLNNPQSGFNKVRTAIKTFADFSFADPRIRFADMTGDGLQDIVLVSSGRVQYWPNMGYGCFGAKVTMKNAPVFPDQYDPSQVLLGDLDGDGQADIVFVDSSGITLFVNQSANSFSKGVKIPGTPRVTDPKALRIIDMMGNGQAGILWSFGLGSATPGKMYFLDFTHGNKPYVLQQMDNNMGSITRVSYGSSITHYLLDEKKPDTKWKTDLPFPVQVVNRVEVLDILSGGKLVTEYNYHNGYWDGVEREFRGFAHVDSFDTESFTNYNIQDLFVESESEFDTKVNTVGPKHYSPPVVTKSWFYVGPVGDGYSRWHEPDFSDEYWAGDVQVLHEENKANHQKLLKKYPRWAQREALRTLRGSLLRSELYALDSSDLQDRPYTVTESCMSFKLTFPIETEISTTVETITHNVFGSTSAEQNTAVSSHCVFFPFNISQRTTQYERGTDPMHSFSFTKEYDNYGQALGQLSIGVPRNFSPVQGVPLYTGPDRTPPISYLASYSLSEFIYADNSSQYMVNRVKRSLSWDLTQSTGNKSVFLLRDDIFDQYTDNPLSITFPVIGCTLNYYDWNGSSTTQFKGLPYGQIGDQGALVRSETLVITDDIISAAYGTNTPQCFKSSPNWTTNYPTAFPSTLQNGDLRLGYKDFRSGTTGHVPGWYAESTRVLYDFQTLPALPIGQQLGLVMQSRDVFDAWTELEYDNYFILPIVSRQYLTLFPTNTAKLETKADYDYRVMQPYKVTDVNDNISVFDFSPLGLLRATALIGKGTEGDYKGGPGTGYYDLYEPSVRMTYDFFAFKNNNDPVWVKTISRELHYVTSAISPTITKCEYSDGFGRLLQTRVQAEDTVFGASPGGTMPNLFGDSGLPAVQGTPNENAVGVKRGTADALNVVVSGWKIYNNKGKVVEQYEPFFDRGFDFLLPGESGQKINLFYDALGRVVKTQNPDKSEQWVIYGQPVSLNDPFDPLLPARITGNKTINSPWVSFSYDANDLASVTNPVGSNVPTTHYFTPKSTTIDALGRTIKTTEFFDNAAYTTNTIEMRYQYDIRGNLLLVTDPYARKVFAHLYDLRPPQKDEDGKQQPLPPLWTKHIDKGESTVLFDAVGKGIESFDAKGAQKLSAYDVISRPVYSWAKNDSGFTICTLRDYLIYGDSAGLTNPKTDNLNGKPYKNYDEAGLIQTPLYDFKGNLITKQRQVIDSTTLQGYLNSYTNFIVDWTGLPSILDSTVFQTDMNYDALNRLTELELPEDLDVERKKIIPTYNTAGALEKVDLYSPAGGGTTTNYVETIAYNAKGQRLLIAFGNSRMTRYAYDTKTFRLLRQRTEGYTKSTAGSIVTYAYTSGTNKQDDGFNYDLIGNIVKIFERVTNCGIQGITPTNNELDRDFEYDSIYRLLYANGRESDTQNANDYLYEDAPVGSFDPTRVRYYERNYSYDKLGNIESVIQGGTDGFTRNYTYNAGTNTLKFIADPGTTVLESYTYDNCGNTLTTNLNRYYVWNHSDQLLSYYNDAGGGPTVYTQYDYAGQDRVSKLVRTGTAGRPIYERTIYIDGIFEYVKLENGTVYEKNYLHIMDDKSRIAELRVGDVFPGDITDDVVYVLEDNIGSSVTRLSDTGTVIDEEEYYPFGDSSLRTFTYKRYRYVGKERDAESGLYYYGARYYAAWTCRFISVDPLAGKYVWQSSYVHADNNPINKVDHNGMGTGEKEPPKQGESRTINGCTDYWDKNAADGKGAWVDKDPAPGLDVSQLYAKDKNGNLLYKDKVKSFELFASTKAGKEFLLMYAKKGFELKGEIVKDLHIKAEKNGFFYEKGIDLTYKYAKQGINTPYTSTFVDAKSGRLRIEVSMLTTVQNPQKRGLLGALDEIDAFVHESFLHVFEQSIRYMAGERDRSKIQGPDHGNSVADASLYFKVGAKVLESLQSHPLLKQLGSTQYSQDQIFWQIMRPGLGSGYIDQKQNPYAPTGSQLKSAN